MSKKQFIQSLERYGSITGIGEVHYDEELGTCFEFEADLELTLLWNDQLACVFASVFCGVVSAEHKSKLYPMLLKANYFWSGTGGATLSYEKDSSGIFLIDKWNVQQVAHPETLTRKINHIVNAGHQWKEHVAAGGMQRNSTVQQPPSYRHIPGLESL
ncbi:hypothetical protein TDB9533_00056 [Thalassocella blandensis]|nr:hypothetical protein TDB9533_00056 [Thalassocella blandensis]